MKSAPLGLAGGREWSLATEALRVDGDRMTALIHYERQRWKKINFFAKKPLQHVQTLCMPSFTDLHTHATAGHVTSFAWSRNTSDRSLACIMIAPHVHVYAIDLDRGETWSTSGKPRGCLIALAHCTALHWKTRAEDNAPQGDRSNCAAAGAGPTWNTLKHFDRSHCTAPVDLLACGSRRSHGHCSRRSSMHLVMTGHNARRPRAGASRKRPWWWLSEASYLLDRLDGGRSILRFPSLLHASEAVLRLLAKGNWKMEVFCGVVGLDGRCSAQAEQRKEPVAVGPLPGAYLSTETNLVPIRGVMKKEFDTGHTHKHTHTHTHTHTHARN